jgi:hypothetical protein
MNEQIQGHVVEEEVPQDAPDVEPQEQQSDPEPEWSGDDAEAARAFGWKPADEWQGDRPPGYIEDPREWIGRVERSPIFKTMKERLDAQEHQQAESLRKLEAVTSMALERQKTEHKRELEALEAQRRQAAEVGDLSAYDDLSKRQDELRAKAPQEIAPPVQQQPPEDPYIVSRRETPEGAWLKNPILAREASEALVAAGMNNSNSTAQEQVEYAERIMREAGRLPKPATPAPRRMVDGGGLGGGSAKSDAFSKLPQDGKDGFAFLVKQGAYSDTKEDRKAYADEYNNA